MKIGLILPKKISSVYLARVEKLVKYYFKKVENIKYFSPYKNFAITIPTYVDKNIFNSDALVIVRDEEENNPLFDWDLDIPVFKTILQGYGGLRIVSGNFYQKKNIFRKIAPANNFAFSPFSYQNNFNVFNDENSFGFRMQEDFYKLKNRKKNHTVIAIFGGSAVYDLCSIEPFTKKLEKKLQKMGYNISVMNFGLYGGDIINDIINFNIYCFDIKPDIVIHYGGLNDIMNALICESELVYKYDFFYSPIYREWNNFLYNKKNISYIKNSPQLILKAYYKRLKQFEKITQSINAKFLFVFQPYFYKKKLSKEELFFIDYYFKKNKNKYIINAVNIIYEQYNKFLDLKYLDLYKKFKLFNDFIFTDLVHVTEYGSEIIAMELVKYLKDENVLQ